MGHFVDTRRRMQLASSCHGFFSRIGDWIDTFDKEDLIFRPYETQQFDSGTICGDFLNILGLEPGERFQLPRQRLNSSWHRDPLEYMNLINAVTKAPSGDRELLAALAAYRPNRTRPAAYDGCLLSPADRLAVVEAYADMNARIARDYLGRPDGRLFYDPLPEVDEPWSAYRGMNRRTATEITRYLHETNSQLVGRLARALNDARSHAGPGASRARRILVPSIFEVCRCPERHALS
jgi:hypothetical protein